MSEDRDQLRRIAIGVAIVVALIALAALNSSCGGDGDDPAQDADVLPDVWTTPDVDPLVPDGSTIDATIDPPDAELPDANAPMSPDADLPPDAATVWTGWSGHYYVTFTTDSMPSPINYATLDLDETTGTGVYRYVSTGAVIGTVVATTTGPATLSLSSYCEGCGDLSCSTFGCTAHSALIGTMTADGFVGDETVTWVGTGGSEVRHLVVER